MSCAGNKIKLFGFIKKQAEGDLEKTHCVCLNADCIMIFKLILP